MMPTQEQIEDDVNKNLTKIFSDEKIKLSKKAEKQVRSLLKETITLKYKMHVLKTVLNSTGNVNESQDKEVE